ncbi:MAG: MATE family efflux transporter [Kiritimatiellaeota bacterium]|nr:MATE family efflux transporter [Kiritimatiellota bacterium]
MSFFKRSIASHFRPVTPSEQGGVREILLVALPLILGSAAEVIMHTTDRLFLARYSDASFQAAFPAGVLTFTFLCLFSQVASYAGVFVAQYNGAKNTKGCLHATAQGMWLGLFSLPFILLLTPLGLLIISRSGFEPAVIPEARAYFLILMLGGLRVPMSFAISGWFTGRQLLKLNTIANLTGTFLNFPLDFLLIFGGEKIGMPWIPAMGIRGAAYATVISGFAPFLMQLWWYLRSKELKENGWRPAFKPDFPLMGRIIRFGFPSALQVLMDISSFTAFFFLIGRLGGLAQMVGNLCITINHLAFAPLMAFGTAVSIVAARCQGAREPHYAARSGWSGVKLGWCWMFPLAVLFAAFPRTFLAPFNPADSQYTLDQLVALGRPMLIMMAVWGVADTVGIVMISALRGVGDTRFVMLCMIVGGWLLWMPAEFVAYRFFNAGLLVLWGILTAYIIGLGGVFAWRWRCGKWMSIKVIEHDVIHER